MPTHATRLLLPIALVLAAHAVAQAPPSAQNPTWNDPATHLMWTANDNGSDVDQPQALAYCRNLQYAGHNDWRLASMDELQGIYTPDASARHTSLDSINYDIHVKGDLNLSTGWVWSSRPVDNPGRPYAAAWFFQFFIPGFSPDAGHPASNFLHFTWHMRALCVRPSAP